MTTTSRPASPRLLAALRLAWPHPSEPPAAERRLERHKDLLPPRLYVG